MTSLTLAPERLLFLQHLEGALQLGILREDLLPRKVFGLVWGAWLLVLPQLHLDVRLDAGPPNRVPVRGQPLGYGEQHGRAVAQKVLVEYGPGPEGRLADHLSPPVVPQCASHDLGARRGALVYQNHQESVQGIVALGDGRL